MNIDFSDKDFRGFNAHAKQKFGTILKSFGSDLVTEANRLESSRNNPSAEPEITSTIVDDAALILRRGFAKPRKNPWLIIPKLAGPILSLLIGILYDSVSLQDKTYMFWFILLIAITILSITISVVKE